MGEPSEERYLFEEMPVHKAVATLAIPTVISQLVTMVYNLADTFFIGQIGNPVMVAAVSLVSPWFNLLTALGNLFGLGGQQPHLPDAGGPEPPGRQACGGLQCVGRRGGHPPLFPWPPTWAGGRC